MIQQKRRTKPTYIEHIKHNIKKKDVENNMFTVKLLIVSSHVGCAHQNVKFSFGDFILITGLV